MKGYTVFVLLCVCVLSGGCSVTIGTGPGPDRPPRRSYPDADVTLSEIDAVSQLSFDSGKLAAYQDIAARPHLSAAAQVYLVQRALDELSFESSRLSVVQTLIKNPDFLAEGKQAILDNLDAFSFDSSKQSVLTSLNRRGYVPSGRQARDMIQTETTVEVEAGYGQTL